MGIERISPGHEKLNRTRDSDSRPTDYSEEIRRQRKVWLNKPVLRLLYNHWYSQCAVFFSSERPVVEIGAGSGNFKSYYQDVISTDIFPSGPWIDVVMDAHALALAPNTTGNVIVFDVLHHLQRPLDFLRHAVASIKLGGRLVVCEPALSPWSRFVYGVFHHEPVDDNWDLLGLGGQAPDEDRLHQFANAAIPELLFWRNRETTVRLLEPCRLVHATKIWISALSADRRLRLSKLSTKYRLRDLAKARGSDHATVRQLADRDANDRGSRETRLNDRRGGLLNALRSIASASQNSNHAEIDQSRSDLAALPYQEEEH